MNNRLTTLGIGLGLLGLALVPYLGIIGSIVAGVGGGLVLVSAIFPGG